MWLLAGLALAHPYANHLDPAGNAALGHKLLVRVDAEAVELTYAAEVPPPILARELGTEDITAEPAAARARELFDGLKVRWDGEVLPLARAGEPTAALNADGLWELTVRMRAERPGGGGRLEVVNANYPDRFAFYYAEVWLPGALVARSTSLAEVKDGRVWSNVHGSWGPSPTARELWVELSRAWPWQRRAEEAPLTDRLAGTNALAMPPGWKAALALAGGVGLGIGTWGLRRRFGRR